MMSTSAPTNLRVYKSVVYKTFAYVEINKKKKNVFI